MSAAPSHLLRDLRALVKPSWKIRVAITRVRSTGETELVRLLLRGADLAAAFELADDQTTIEAGPEPEPEASLDDFAPTDLQRAILFCLLAGPQTTPRIAKDCGVTTGLLFDRGGVMHELVARGLVARQSRGYALTAAGKEFVDQLEATP
jgi:hypothetical protein